MYFVCSQSGALGLVVPPEAQKYKEGETYIGSDTIVATGFDTTGYITAYDMSTGKIEWQNKPRRILLFRCGDHRRRPAVRR